MATAPLSWVSGQKPRSHLWFLTVSQTPYPVYQLVLSTPSLKLIFNLTTLHPSTVTPFGPSHIILPGLLQKPLCPTTTLKTNQSTSLLAQNLLKFPVSLPPSFHCLLPSLTLCQPHWCFSYSNTETPPLLQVFELTIPLLHLEHCSHWSLHSLLPCFNGASTQLSATEKGLPCPPTHPHSLFLTLFYISP